MLCQKNFKDTPKAIEGTIIGILINVSRNEESQLPNVLRASNIAIGMPRIIPKTVTMASGNLQFVEFFEFW